MAVSLSPAQALIQPRRFQETESFGLIASERSTGPRRLVVATKSTGMIAGDLSAIGSAGRYRGHGATIRQPRGNPCPRRRCRPGSASSPGNARRRPAPGRSSATGRSHDPAARSPRRCFAPTWQRPSASPAGTGRRHRGCRAACAARGRSRWPVASARWPRPGWRRCGPGSRTRPQAIRRTGRPRGGAGRRLDELTADAAGAGRRCARCLPEVAHAKLARRPA